MRRIVAAFSLLTVTMTLGGCGVLPWTVATFAPPEKSKPVFNIPKDKKVLVFVESDPTLTYVSGVEMVRADLAEQIDKELVKNEVVTTTIPQARLLNVLDSMSNKQASIPDVGKKAGADLVLYVKIRRLVFQDTPDTTLWTGRMQTTVKIVDVNKGPVFPTVEKDYPVKSVELPPVDDSSPTYSNVVAKALAIKMGDRIAKLFYEYDLPKTGEPISLE